MPPQLFVSSFIICSGNAGSGLCVFSKFPIVAVRTHPFLTHKGMFDVMALSNELFLGKGCLSCRLKTPAGYIRLFVLHVSVLFSPSVLLHCASHRVSWGNIVHACEMTELSCLPRSHQQWYDHTVLIPSEFIV